MALSIVDYIKRQINDMINKGVARKLTEEEVSWYQGPVHYLLHHHKVIKQGSSSKPVRIVFDSSATYQGHQLNSYWAKGPDMLNSLLGVLLRMRQEKIVVIFQECTILSGEMKGISLLTDSSAGIWMNLNHQSIMP